MLYWWQGWLLTFNSKFKFLCVCPFIGLGREFMRLRKSSMFLSALQKNISGFFCLFLYSCSSCGKWRSKRNTTPVTKTGWAGPFQFDLATNLIAAQAIREEFGKATDLSLDVYYEYLDFNRFAYLPINKRFLIYWQPNIKINRSRSCCCLAVRNAEALADTARRNFTEYTNRFFPDVFTEHLNGLDLPANMTVSGTEDCTKSIWWLLDAMPEVNEVVLVMGAGKIEQGFFDHIQKLQENMKGQVKFTDCLACPWQRSASGLQNCRKLRSFFTIPCSRMRKEISIARWRQSEN